MSHVVSRWEPDPANPTPKVGDRVRTVAGVDVEVVAVSTRGKYSVCARHADGSLSLGTDRLTVLREVVTPKPVPTEPGWWVPLDRHGRYASFAPWRLGPIGWRAHNGGLVETDNVTSWLRCTPWPEPESLPVPRRLGPDDPEPPDDSLVASGWEVWRSAIGWWVGSSAPVPLTWAEWSATLNGSPLWLLREGPAA